MASEWFSAVPPCANLPPCRGSLKRADETSKHAIEVGKELTTETKSSHPPMPNAAQDMTSSPERGGSM